MDILKYKQANEIHEHIIAYKRVINELADGVAFKWLSDSQNSHVVSFLTSALKKEIFELEERFKKL